MNVGEYVRTKKGIAKIIDKLDDVRFSYSDAWVTDTYLEINDDTEYIYDEDIIKSSPQIIDLIEENDYIRIITDTDFRRIYNSYGKLVIYREKELLIETFSNKFIGGIITHEQMEAMQYRVEE